MNKLDTLITHFEKFPGIGARQARRFAFHVLRLSEKESAELADLITTLKHTVKTCTLCQRYFSQNGGTSELCTICGDPNRDTTKLLVVSQDSDIQAIERAGIYQGLYFVLGGMAPLLESKTNNKLRSQALRATVESRCTDGLQEVILGFAVNPDGENTGRYVESLLKELIADHTLHITYLGRGLSTGSELEYADPETIKNALSNRFSL